MRKIFYNYSVWSTRAQSSDIITRHTIVTQGLLAEESDLSTPHLLITIHRTVSALRSQHLAGNPVLSLNPRPAVYLLQLVKRNN